MMVEILAGVGLVVHEEALVAEPQILDEDGVTRELLVAVVDDLDPPEPYVQAWMQPEGGAMADAAFLSVPHVPVVGSANAKVALGPHQGQDRSLRAADAQIKTSHAVADRGCQRLIDHNAAVRLHVFDREDGAAWQEADRKPGAVGDPREIEVISARRRQDLDR